MPQPGIVVSEETSAHAIGVEAVVLAGPSGSVIAAAGEQAIGWLSPTERERSAAFRFDRDRTDFQAAHLLARICAGRLVGVPPASIGLGQRCPTCGGPHGRPHLVGYSNTHVSWAHGRGYVAAAAATVPIAVDVEAAGSDRLSDELVRAVLDPAEAAAVRGSDHPEQAFLLQWTRRECLIKLGLSSLDRIGRIRLTDLHAKTSPPPATWRLWRDGLATIDWVDDHAQAVGTAMLRSGVASGRVVGESG